MSRNWMRRALLAAVCASSALMVACGSGTTESALSPARFVAFGDGFSDLGEGGARYTINDGSANIWSQYMANLFGQNLTTAGSGGLSYARGNARVSLKPDAAGSNATPTVTEQVDRFLAGNTIGANDVLIISGGFSDIIVQMAAVRSGAQTSAQMLVNVRQAGRDLATQVRRLVTAGARYVVLVGPYNLAKTPWATAIGQGDLLLEATSRFNEDMLVALADLGSNVLYVDAALHFNLMTASPGAYNLTDSTSVMCTSADAGPGIGIGAGQVNSALCTTNTIVSGFDYTRHVFADPVYPTPQAHRLFGEYAYNRVRARW